MFFALGGGGDGESEEKLAHRLCFFALKTINEDMRPLFDKFVPVFDQDFKDVEQQGETHAQYEAYQEYLSALQGHLTRFAAQEGYDDPEGSALLAEIQRNCAEDKERAEKEMRSAMEAIKLQRRMLMGDSPMDAEEDAAMEQLATLFKPQTVEDLMQTVLHMTDYETFSSLMRAKVQRENMIREVHRRKAEMLHGEMGLAHRFVEFAMKMLNDDLEEFYCGVLPRFEQDFENFQQQGHTHEQYAAYQEYVAFIEAALVRFSHQEGFANDLNALFTELQRLVLKDKERVDADMKRTLAEIEERKAKLRKEHERRQAAGESDGMAFGEPMMLVCKPQSLLDLMNAFVGHTTYVTFSGLMRSRVEMEKAMKQLFSALTSEFEAALVKAEAEQQAPQQQAICNAAPSANPTASKAAPAALPATLGGFNAFKPPPRTGGMGLFASSTASANSTFAAMVPEGCQAGSEINVTTPDGQYLKVSVPDGLEPSNSFDVSYIPLVKPQAANASSCAAASKFCVTVPDGCQPGTQVTAMAPDGQVLVVTVPDGVAAGNFFEVEYVPQASVA